MQSPLLRGPIATQPKCSCSPSRRGFLSGLVSLGASAALPGCGDLLSRTQPTAPALSIDIHHHLFSPAYVAALSRANLAPPIVRNWSLAHTLEDMEAAGVTTSILSMTT